MEDLIKTILEIPEETQTIEFKRLNEKTVVRKILQTIVAMANTEGGKIIIGVDDPEKTKLKGIDRIFGIEEYIEAFDEIFHGSKKIIPPIPKLESSLIKIDSINKNIAILDVPKSTESFLSINNDVFIRLNKGNQKLTPQEIIKFNYAKGFEKADEELVDVDFELLDTQYFDDWRVERQIPKNKIEKVLFETGLARKNKEGILKPTRAAVLLFALYPTNILDTKCAIRIYRYQGTIEKFQETPNLIGQPKTINGPIIDLIKKAHDYILGILETGIEIHSGFITKYKIPSRAIKELITNAVIHRDYYIKRDIEVNIFEDRIEVNSPGLFTSNITKNNIGYVRAENYRNDLIVKHLREFPDPPNLDRNEGVKAIRNEMDKKNLFPPIFITYPIVKDSVRAILLNEERPSEWEKINQYLEINKYIGNKKAREITGVTQIYKMSRLLKRWVQKGLLIKIKPESGSLKGIKYKLANKEETV